MADTSFETSSGTPVAAVTAAKMRAVDRIAVEEVGLALLQMMENAGRTLAWHARAVGDGPVRVMAGNGGNGGGGLACARHLANNDVSVEVVLDRESAALSGAAARQHAILTEMDRPPVIEPDESDRSGDPSVLVDALVGYGLRGEVEGSVRRLIESMNRRDEPVVSLDVPSGVDATAGETCGIAVTPARTVTLALPKTGLVDRSEPLFLADIGIPHTVYERVGVEYETPFERRPWIQLKQ